MHPMQAGGLALVATALQRGGVRERLADALCLELGLTGRCVRYRRYSGPAASHKCDRRE